MKQLGINQSELARRMKVSKPCITKVLRQDVNFSFRTAAKLARALEMDFFPIDLINQIVYNTRHQMTVRTDNSDFGRYSPAYATGRERILRRLTYA